jgi:hypothetical protein
MKMLLTINLLGCFQTIFSSFYVISSFAVTESVQILIFFYKILNIITSVGLLNKVRLP